jgi:hypothetical protein
MTPAAWQMISRLGLTLLARSFWGSPPVTSRWRSQSHWRLRGNSGLEPGAAGALAAPRRIETPPDFSALWGEVVAMVSASSPQKNSIARASPRCCASSAD